MGSTSFLIGLGSNRRHGRHGGPTAVLEAAVDALEDEGLKLKALSRTMLTPAMGPAGRDFANAALIIKTKLSPPALLATLKSVERSFGRRRGRRWGARVLDLDILLWSRGRWRSKGLAIPHTALAVRDFALEPAAEIAPGWRHPDHGATLRQLDHRRRKARPVDPRSLRP